MKTLLSSQPMQIVSLSSIPVGGYAWRPRCGGHAFVVIAKATFELTPGLARLAATQDGLNETDNHWDDDRSCSVYAPSDMAPFKERADISLVGNAYAPSPAGAKNAIVRMSVAGIDKKVAVHCDRYLDANGRVQEGKPFTHMALRYERAAGGKLSDNPVGIEPATKANRAKGKRRLPNLQTIGRGRRPAGFGPLGSQWPMRKRLLRSAAKRFQDPRWRETPLPSALDCTYFNDAPLDQRADSLRSDERIVLENLHPQHRRLCTRLPGIEPRAFAETDGTLIDVHLTPDSLWIDMTRGVCTVTWRGSFEINRLDQPGRVLVALQQPGEVLTADDFTEMQKPRSTRDSDVHICAQRPRMQTVDLAAGAEEYFYNASPSEAPLPFVEPEPTETLLAHAPAEPLPFSKPERPAAIAPPSAATVSPWAGNVSARSCEPILPPSNPDSVAPPPLMLVPPPSAPPKKRSVSASLMGPLPKTHRVELLGTVDRELARVQRKWRLVEDEAPEEKLNRELRAAFGDVDTPDPTKARRHLVRIMTNESASDAADMRELMLDAVDEDGVFDAPLTLTHGTLRFSFDAVQVLRATIASVATYLKDNEALREEVESARDILNNQDVAPEAAADLTKRIEKELAGIEGLDVATIDARIERMLLEQRAYEKKNVLGKVLVRALISVNGNEMPCYLQRDVADALPLYRELPARMIAELHPRQDQREESPRALAVIALGRVVSREEEC